MSSSCHFLMDSPIGTLMLVKTDGSLSGLYMGEAPEVRPELLGARVREGFDDVEGQLEEYFARKRQVFEMPLVPYTLLTLLGSAVWSFAFAGAGLGLTTYMRSFFDFDYVGLAIVPLFLFLPVLLALAFEEASPIRNGERTIGWHWLAVPIVLAGLVALFVRRVSLPSAPTFDHRTAASATGRACSSSPSPAIKSVP